MTGEEERGTVHRSTRPLVLVDCFPTRSETFVLSEIVGLRSLGLAVHVFALQAGDPGMLRDSHATADLPITFSRGPLADLRAAGPLQLQRQVSLVRTLFSEFRGDLRWLIFALRRIGTVQLAARVAVEHSATSIHAHFWGAPTAIALCVSKITGLPLSTSPHASLAAFSPSTSARVLARAAFTAACWMGAARHLSHIGPRVHYVPHGVDLELFRAGERHSENLHILVIGRLVEKKGVAVLLEALELLSQDRTDWFLTVVGDGPQRIALERRLARGSLASRVRFRGWVSQKEVARLLRTADVLVVPSIPVRGETEGIPNVILEAFAAKVPVIASDVGGVSEVVKEGETGILVPPGNRDVLAERLLGVCRGEEPVGVLVEAARAVIEDSHQRERWLSVLADLHRGAAGAEGVEACGRCPPGSP